MKEQETKAMQSQMQQQQLQSSEQQQIPTQVASPVLVGTGDQENKNIISHNKQQYEDEDDDDQDSDKEDEDDGVEFEDDEEQEDEEDENENFAEVSPKGRFKRFYEELGRGAYKVVYRGIDLDQGREIAWNQIGLLKLPSSDQQRIKKEIDLIKSLEHPNIIHFISAWRNKDKKEVVFITEITSGTLRAYQKRNKITKLRVIKGWCQSILKGLVYLHEQELPILHRDLKCDNIFINSNSGDIRIGDLGLSTPMNRSYTSSVLGTPEFMAPELYEEHYDCKVDIYAFGMCMLEMITQSLPYNECESPAQIYRKVTAQQLPKALSRIRDQEVYGFINKCLSFDKDQRPTARELLESPFIQTLDDEKCNFSVPLGPPISRNTKRASFLQQAQAKHSIIPEEEEDREEDPDAAAQQQQQSQQNAAKKPQVSSEEVQFSTKSTIAPQEDPNQTQEAGKIQSVINVIKAEGFENDIEDDLVQPQSYNNSNKNNTLKSSQSFNQQNNHKFSKNLELDTRRESFTSAHSYQPSSGLSSNSQAIMPQIQQPVFKNSQSVCISPQFVAKQEVDDRNQTPTMIKTNYDDGMLSNQSELARTETGNTVDHTMVDKKQHQMVDNFLISPPKQTMNQQQSHQQQQFSGTDETQKMNPQRDHANVAVSQYLGFQSQLKEQYAQAAVVSQQNSHLSTHSNDTVQAFQSSPVRENLKSHLAADPQLISHTHQQLQQHQAQSQTISITIHQNSEGNLSQSSGLTLGRKLTDIGNPDCTFLDSKFVQENEEQSVSSGREGPQIAQPVNMFAALGAESLQDNVFEVRAPSQTRLRIESMEVNQGSSGSDKDDKDAYEASFPFNNGVDEVDQADEQSDDDDEESLKQKLNDSVHFLNKLDKHKHDKMQNHHILQDQMLQEVQKPDYNENLAVSAINLKQSSFKKTAQTMMQNEQINQQDGSKKLQVVHQQQQSHKISQRQSQTNSNRNGNGNSANIQSQMQQNSNGVTKKAKQSSNNTNNNDGSKKPSHSPKTINNNNQTAFSNQEGPMAVKQQQAPTKAPPGKKFVEDKDEKSGFKLIMDQGSAQVLQQISSNGDKPMTIVKGKQKGAPLAVSVPNVGGAKKQKQHQQQQQQQQSSQQQLQHTIGNEMNNTKQQQQPALHQNVQFQQQKSQAILIGNNSSNNNGSKQASLTSQQQIMHSSQQVNTNVNRNSKQLSSSDKEMHHNTTSTPQNIAESDDDYDSQHSSSESIDSDSGDNFQNNNDQQQIQHQQQQQMQLQRASLSNSIKPTVNIVAGGISGGTLKHSSSLKKEKEMNQQQQQQQQQQQLTQQQQHQLSHKQHQAAMNKPPHHVSSKSSKQTKNQQMMMPISMKQASNNQIVANSANGNNSLQANVAAQQLIGSSKHIKDKQSQGVTSSQKQQVTCNDGRANVRERRPMEKNSRSSSNLVVPHHRSESANNRIPTQSKIQPKRNGEPKEGLQQVVTNSNNNGNQNQIDQQKLADGNLGSQQIKQPSQPVSSGNIITSKWTKSCKEVINITIQYPNLESNQRKGAAFDFNIKQDTSHGVANEMVNELSVNPEFTRLIKQEIEQSVRQFQDLENEKAEKEREKLARQSFRNLQKNLDGFFGEMKQLGLQNNKEVCRMLEKLYPAAQQEEHHQVKRNCYIDGLAKINKAIKTSNNMATKHTSQQQLRLPAQQYSQLVEDHQQHATQVQQQSLQQVNNNSNNIPSSSGSNKMLIKQQQQAAQQQQQQLQAQQQSILVESLIE